MLSSFSAVFHRFLNKLGDPVGIRTRDPQLRRLLLYPAELPDLSSECATRKKTRFASFSAPQLLLFNNKNAFLLLISATTLYYSATETRCAGFMLHKFLLFKMTKQVLSF